MFKYNNNYIYNEFIIKILLSTPSENFNPTNYNYIFFVRVHFNPFNKMIIIIGIYMLTIYYNKYMTQRVNILNSTYD